MKQNFAQKGAAEKKTLAKRVAEEAKRVVEAREAKEKQDVEAQEASREKITLPLVERLNQGSQSSPKESKDHIPLLGRKRKVIVDPELVFLSDTKEWTLDLLWQFVYPHRMLSQSHINQVS